MPSASCSAVLGKHPNKIEYGAHNHLHGVQLCGADSLCRRMSHLIPEGPPSAFGVFYNHSEINPLMVSGGSPPNRLALKQARLWFEEMWLKSSIHLKNFVELLLSPEVKKKLLCKCVDIVQTICTH